MPSSSGLVITDLTVIPWQRRPRGPRGHIADGKPGLWAGKAGARVRLVRTGPDVPPGGIPTRLIRALNTGQLITLAQQEPSGRCCIKGWRSRPARRKAKPPPQRLLPADGARERLPITQRIREAIGPRGNGIDHYLLWALRYHEKTWPAWRTRQGTRRRARRRDGLLRPGHHHGRTSPVWTADDIGPGAGRWHAHAEGTRPDSGTRASRGGQQCRVNRSTNSPPVVGKSVTATPGTAPTPTVRPEGRRPGPPGRRPHQGTDRNLGGPELGKVTFARWVDEWRGTTVDLRSSTRARYERDLRLHILPRFGKAQLTRSGRAMSGHGWPRCQHLRSRCRAIRRRFSVFRKVMGDAVAMEMIARVAVSRRHSPARCERLDITRPDLPPRSPSWRRPCRSGAESWVWTAPPTPASAGPR